MSKLAVKRITWMSLLVATAALAGGCSRGHRAEHAIEREAPEPPPPTPDTTPIPALRTPAGLVLGVEGTPVPAPLTPEMARPIPQTPTPPLP
jgi:hypothetical protein